MKNRNKLFDSSVIKAIFVGSTLGIILAVIVLIIALPNIIVWLAH